MAQESSCSRWRADRDAAGESHAARLPFVVVFGLARKNAALMTWVTLANSVRSVVCNRFCIVRTGASHHERSATESCGFASALNERFVFAILASQFL
jgi:hypothetical protein